MLVRSANTDKILIISLFTHKFLLTLKRKMTLQRCWFCALQVIYNNLTGVHVLPSYCFLSYQWFSLLELSKCKFKTPMVNNFFLFFVSFRIFLDNTRVRIFIFFFCRAKREFFFPEFNIRLYDKNSESHYFFFPPPKSEYFFQQHWESEYFFRNKT